MLIYRYGVENKYASCFITVDIEYDLVPAEYAGGVCTFSGSLDLVNVRVVEIEGFSLSEDTTYRHYRKDLDEGWVKDADAIVYATIEAEIDRGGWLTNVLWNNS